MSNHPRCLFPEHFLHPLKRNRIQQAATSYFSFSPSRWQTLICFRLRIRLAWTFCTNEIRQYVASSEPFSPMCPSCGNKEPEHFVAFLVFCGPPALHSSASSPVLAPTSWGELSGSKIWWIFVSSHYVPAACNGFPCDALTANT